MKIFKAIRAFVNTLYEGTQNTGKRKFIQRIATDSRVTLNPYTRTEALSRARKLYANEGFTRGAINDLARYAIGTGIVPQAQTKDADWNTAAEAYFQNVSNVIDITGKNTLPELCKLFLKSMLVDGDLGVILNSTPTGFPQIQTVLGHRIGSGSEKVPDDMHDGVLLNAQERPIAYRVLTDDAGGYQDIPAANFIYLGEQNRTDETRCISSLIHALNNMQDWDEIVGLEKLGVKSNALIGFIRKKINDDDNGTLGKMVGETDPISDIKREELQGALIPTLPVGEEIQSFKSERPNPNIKEFADVIIRPVARGLGVPVEFVWDPSKLGGANVRLIVHQVQWRIAELQQLLIYRFLRRLYAWIIAKGVKNGDLTENPEWWKVAWQCPSSITVDVGREAQQNREDIKLGIRTYAEDYAERGRYWEDELRQKAKEAQLIQSLATEFGVPMDRIASISANPVAAAPTPSSQDQQGATP